MADADIPLNADKILFAETLVNHVFRDYDDIFVYTIPEDVQNEVYAAFTDRVEFAVNLIEVSLQQEVETIFRKMEEDGSLSEETFLDHAAKLRKKCFRQGFDAENFLNYCVHVSMLACKFHPTDGFGAQEAAVSCIMACFENNDMFSGGWETLQSVAEKFQQASACMPTPSPQSDDYAEEFVIPKEAELSWIRKGDSDDSSAPNSEGNDEVDANHTD